MRINAKGVGLTLDELHRASLELIKVMLRPPKLQQWPFHSMHKTISHDKETQSERALILHCIESLQPSTHLIKSYMRGALFGSPGLLGYFFGVVRSFWITTIVPVGVR